MYLDLLWLTGALLSNMGSTSDFWQEYSAKPAAQAESTHTRRLREIGAHGATRGEGVQKVRRAGREQAGSPGLRYRREQVARIKNEIARTGDASKLSTLKAARSGLARQEELRRAKQTRRNAE